MTDNTDKKRGKLLEERLSYQVRGCFYAVSKKYGQGLKEKVYQKALAEEFIKQGLKFKEQKKINLYSKESGKILGSFIPDFIVENKIIVEIKSSPFTILSNYSQLKSYLKASFYEIAYLVNFGTERLDIKRYIFTNDRKPSVKSVPSVPSVKSLSSVSSISSVRSMSFTLMEIFIIIALVALIATAALVTLNPKKQIEKGWDGKRKNELGQLKKVLEDWYNDKNCYPKPQEICYDSPQSLTDSTYTCHVCGNEENSPSFSPYLPKLPCDPQQPTKKFLYQTDSLSCPSYYRLYTRLSFHADPAVAEVGCQFFCGPVNEPVAYNYVVTSPNTGPQSTESRSLYYCSGVNNCTSVEQDRLPNQIKICEPSYDDPNCNGSGCPEASQCYYQNL